MLSKTEEKRILKKQKKFQHLISAETGIDCSNSPTKYLIVCNAGLSSGIDLCQLIDETKRYGKVMDVVMIPGKSYCFLECVSEIDASSIYSGLHGIAPLAQNNCVIYLSYCISVPKIENPWKEQWPTGLFLIENIVTPDEEEILMKIIDSHSDGELKHRVVSHFGYEFIYGLNNVDCDKPLNRLIPEECNVLWNRLKDKNLDIDWMEPDQMTSNTYQPGHGIPHHVDTHSAFLDPIFSLSLGSAIVMEFRRNNKSVFVDLPARSLLIMSGESRYDWTHGIVPRKFDIVNEEGVGLSTRPRSLRTSLTFRRLRRKECDCNYPIKCDSYQRTVNNNTEKLKAVASELEENYVHKVYNQIADHFSNTRHSPWPKVEEFINSLSVGSILVDIGCGNGKYLFPNSSYFKMGCDRSEGLLKIGSSRGFSLFQCDCLAVPILSNSVDAAISIAVIHHLSTEVRRRRAIEEMFRILVKGGRALIYVWAKDQKANNKQSSYLRQNRKNRKQDQEINSQNNVSTEVMHLELENETLTLPVHTNRTQFVHQDNLVPWKLKGTHIDNKEPSKVYNRFYHVFEQEELEGLCETILGLKILNSYYDQGNWCIIFEKQ